PEDLERMEARLAKKLHLLDIPEAVQLIDIAGIGTEGHASSAVFELVDEGHPQPEIVLPCYFLLGTPVEPVRSVGDAAGFVVFPERGQGVLFMPLGAALSA